MREGWRIGPPIPDQNAKVRVGRRADLQRGRVSWVQLRALGVSKGTISTWAGQRYLILVLPGVYAVGHAAPSIEADLFAAVLYAGPGAMLSHATAAWWWGLIEEQPRVIHVSTPRRCRSQPGVVVHDRRACQRLWHRELPISALPQTFLDLASMAPLRIVRRALAAADYRGVLDVEAAGALLSRGRPGSARLRAALADHQPKLARTRSELELLFLELCEAAGLPLPEVNGRVAGWEVDALWRAERVAVELDGYHNHRSPAQIKRDRCKELALRAAGLTPLRYSAEQLTADTAAVLADLSAAGIAGCVPIPPARSVARESR